MATSIHEQYRASIERQKGLLSDVLSLATELKVAGVCWAQLPLVDDRVTVGPAVGFDKPVGVFQVRLHRFHNRRSVLHPVLRMMGCLPPNSGILEPGGFQVLLEGGLEEAVAFGLLAAAVCGCELSTHDQNGHREVRRRVTAADDVRAFLHPSGAWNYDTYVVL